MHVQTDFAWLHWLGGASQHNEFCVLIHYHWPWRPLWEALYSLILLYDDSCAILQVSHIKPKETLLELYDLRLYDF